MLGVSGNASQLSSACFSADTRLITRGHGWRRIDEIAVGDEVLSRDEDNPQGPLEWKKVEEVFQRFGFVVQLYVGGRVIKTTVEHPFYVRDKGWLPAGELRRGDLLTSHEGEWLAVEEVFDSGDYERLYNLRVADWHTYFVGAGQWGFSVWAHNACHGNSYASTATTQLYALFSKTGELLKFGISSNLARRYPKGYLADKVLQPLLQGSRPQMAALEKFFVNQAGGKLNCERWRIPNFQR